MASQLPVRPSCYPVFTLVRVSWLKVENHFPNVLKMGPKKRCKSQLTPDLNLWSLMLIFLERSSQSVPAKSALKGECVRRRARSRQHSGPAGRYSRPRPLVRPLAGPVCRAPLLHPGRAA